MKRLLAVAVLVWAGGVGADAAPATTVAITDSSNQWVGVSTVGGAKALKVDVVQNASSGLTDAQLRAAAVPVSGTFWQATQPVSGTFWQATQPVSGTVTSNIGTTNGLALDATLTGGTQKTKLVDSGGTNVATVSAGGAVKVDGSAATQPVSGTFWQATQPVSGTVTANAGSGTMAVSGTFWQATQPVSAAALPLPAGASTSAKQPALGVAGTASADVISVQGIASMTALKVDGSGVTQPVSGTFWQATQPVSGTVTATANQNGTWTVQPGNTQNSTAWKTTDAGDGTVAATAPTVAMLAAGRATADAASPTARTAGQLADLVATLEGRLLVDTTHPRRVSCRLTSSATTSTAITGCTAPGAGLSLYVTDISVYGGVATGATAAASIQYGTGGTCGTGTTIIYDCQHPATGGCESHYTTPKKAAANSELCIVDATVGTKFVSVSGYISP